MPQPILTRKQGVVLRAIKRVFARRGIPPTIRELGSLVGLEGQTAAVIGHLKALERKGFIRRHPRTSRGIVLVVQANKE